MIIDKSKYKDAVEKRLHSDIMRRAEVKADFYSMLQDSFKRMNETGRMNNKGWLITRLISEKRKSQIIQMVALEIGAGISYPDLDDISMKIAESSWEHSLHSRCTFFRPPKDWTQPEDIKTGFDANRPHYSYYHNGGSKRVKIYMGILGDWFLGYKH